MITTILLVLAVLIPLGMLVANRKKILTEVKTTTRYGDQTDFKVNFRYIIVPIMVLVVFLLTAMIQPFTVQRVDAGHIGIKVNLTGDNRGVSKYTYKTGWVVYNTWTESLYEFPTFQQHIEYKDQTVITKGGFSATIRPSFNYSIVPTAVGDMFQNLRLGIKEVEQGWLKTAIVGAVNDVANRWTVDEIFNKREEFEAAIVVECNKRVSKWFSVSQLRTNITPPPALQAAIENKTKAIQEAQAADNQKLVAEAEGKRKIAIAKADSAQAVITASGKANAQIISAKAEAEAMRVKQRELSPLYIEFIKVSNWNGQNPTTILGGGASTLVTVK